MQVCSYRCGYAVKLPTDYVSLHAGGGSIRRRRDRKGDRCVRAYQSHMWRSSEKGDSGASDQKRPHTNDQIKSMISGLKQDGALVFLKASCNNVVIIMPAQVNTVSRMAADSVEFCYINNVRRTAYAEH